MNYAVYLTDHYAFGFLSLAGIANALAAYLFWHWLADYGYSKGGVIAGLLYFSTLPLINGHIINVRSFAMVLS